MVGKMKQWLLALLGLAFVGGLAVLWVQFPGERPVLVDAFQPPKLVVESAEHDLGAVPTDSQVNDTFRLLNQGGETLRIHKVDASCGCTVAALSSKAIEPGQSAELNITLDTSLKLGPVVKTIDVYSNDPNNARQVLSLKANVVPKNGMDAPASVHQGHIQVENPLVLFQGECKTCHVDRGVGKTGKALFIADCAMCHGPNAEGAVSPPLLYGNYEDPAYRAYVQRIIAEGSPHNPGMPPYAQAKGGPLTDSQIESLVKFLRYQHQLYQSGQLDVRPWKPATTP